MTLEALAPDQRAVVQLVLQQERTYDELAALLGISAEAVRERAHAGLNRLADSGSLTAEERGELTDYLLGQQSVSRREATRELLSSSADARAWAREVSDTIGDVARSPLPEIPDGGDSAPAAPTADVAAETTTVAVDDLDLDEEDLEDETDERPSGTASPLGRPRPRPRPRPTGQLGAPAAERKPRRSSLLGGALLLFGVGLVVAAVLVWVITGGDDDDNGAGNGEATPTATATPAVQPAGAIELRAPRGGKARGRLTVYISEQGQIAFTIEGTNVPASKEGEAYAVWLTGGDKPRRLGFAPPVAASGEDKGRLGTSGPREQDAEEFPQWFADARNVIVSRETTQDATRPGPTVLTGRIPRGG